MNKYLFIILLSLFTTLSILYLTKNNVSPAITYFPIDTNATFELAETTLDAHLNSKNRLTDVTWRSRSISNESFYLRQDISLLYNNGMFKGIQSHWKQNVNTIELNNKFNHTGNGNFQAITFHFGEIHQSNHDIKSIFKMSYDHLFSDKDDAHSRDQLLSHWKELLTYFKIDSSSYEVIPLTELYLYNEKTLPLLTKTETDKVIGQLWEGLYKNYAIPLLQNKGKLANHYIPLILFDKQAKYLLVLFEWNDEKVKLLQKY